MEDDQARVELVRSHYAAYNAHDVEAQLETLHPAIEIIAIDEAGNPRDRCRGLDEARVFFDGIREAAAETRADLESIRIDRDRAYVSLELSGRLRSTGEEGAIHAVHVHDFEDDRIVRIQSYRPEWRSGTGAGLPD